MYSLKPIHLSTLFLIGTLACNSPLGQTGPENAASSDSLLIAKSEQLTEDSPAYDMSSYPIDTLFTTDIIGTGTYHAEEFSDDSKTQKWIGLFYNKLGYYLEFAKLKTARVHDPIVDENETTKTGWEIATTNPDTAVVLIAASDLLKPHQVQHVQLSEQQLFPGDSIQFTFLGQSYKLLATGEKKKVRPDSDEIEVRNYKLYLIANLDGQERKTLLVAKPYFDDNMISILFAGDIDDDGRLDLILDTSIKYNATSPTLYLSKPALQKELVIPIGQHTSVGC